MAKWKIERTNFDSEELKRLLNKGWEPFAVSNQGVKVWLKKEIKTRQKGKKNG